MTYQHKPYIGKSAAFKRHYEKAIFSIIFLDSPDPCLEDMKGSPCCNLTYGLSKNLHAIMKVMKFATNTGKNHFNLESLIGDNLNHTFKYPLIPLFKIKSSDYTTVKDINTMIPVCKMKKYEYEKLPHDYDTCDLFQPVISDMGICQSYNPTSTLDMLNPSFYTESFRKAYLEDLKPNQTISFGERHGQSLNFFLAMSSRHPRQDHNGALLSDQEPANFYVGISTKEEYFQMKSSGFAVKAGYKTTINVQPMEISASEDLRSVAINKRNCRFSDELGDLVIFKSYSQSACNFEKNMRQIHKLCHCVPWYFPTPFGQDYTICSYYGMQCVEDVREVLKPSDDCLPLCNQVQYSYNQVLEKINVESTCQKWSLWKSIPQRIYNKKDLSLYFMVQKLKEWKITPSNETFDATKARLEFCKYMIDFNMAEVQVKFGTKKYIKTVTGLRMQFTDKLGVFGKFLIAKKPQK